MNETFFQIQHVLNKNNHCFLIATFINFFGHAEWAGGFGFWNLARIYQERALKNNKERNTNEGSKMVQIFYPYFFQRLSPK
jgi:hypothetical protein